MALDAFHGSLVALGRPRGLRCDPSGWVAWGTGWAAQGVGTATRLWPLTDVVDVVSSADGAVALSGDGSIVALAPLAMQGERRLEGVQRRLGNPWATAYGADGWRAYNWRTGVHLPLPIGAVRPRPGRPGAGLLWVDETTVYRLDDGGVRVAATLPSPPLAWEQGPLGAACFELGDSIAVVAPRSPLRMVRAELVVDGARFSQDGAQVLLASVDGVAVVDTASGRVVDQAEGELHPVGFGPAPTVWDEERHSLRELAGVVVLEGLCGAVPYAAANLLMGPGGRCWNLQAGQRLWGHACLEKGIVVVVGASVACVGQSEVVWLDEQGQARSWVDLDLPGGPLRAAAYGNAVAVWSAAGAVVVGPDGSVTPWPAAPLPAPLPDVSGPHHGHIWTSDGLLLRLQPERDAHLE